MIWKERHDLLLLGAVLALLLATIWVRPAGAPLVEHDETRYAEIAREMLVSGDYTVPHLNGVAWYEKPPLLFWAGAASMRVFGATPWAARLPARLAGIGTLVLVLFWVAREGDRRRALLAAALVAGTPLAWGIAQLNLTDGLLTFFVTLSIFAGHAATRSEGGRARFVLALVAGLASGCAFLAKGLVGIMFPAAIVGLWALSVRRWREFAVGAITWAAAALAVIAPWLATVGGEAPEYLRYFLIREHFQRFASTVHDRQQPPFFAAAAFAVALTPVLGVFLAALRRRAAPFTKSDRLLVIWFAFVVLFFSFSRSQLASYVAPAMPAACAFIALRFTSVPLGVGPWVVQASLATASVLAALFLPDTARLIADPQTEAAVLAAGVALIAAAWSAVVIARRDRWAAMAVSLSGYVVLYAVLVAAWPRTTLAMEMVALRDTIERVRRDGAVQVVNYRTFLRGLPWLMQSTVPFVDPGGELAEGSRTLVESGDRLAWSDAEFWRRWRHGEGLMAVVKERDIAEFEQRAGEVPFIVAGARGHLLLSRSDRGTSPSDDPRISTALFVPGPGSTAVPIASIPARIIARARRELKGATIVRAILEQGKGEIAYELVSGGPVPCLVEFDSLGRLVYTEELLSQQDVPPAVAATLKQLAPRSSVHAVKRERRGDGGLDRFDILVSDAGTIRELEIDSAGHPSD